MRNIDTIHIELTDKCNLNCNYCYQKYRKNKGANVNLSYMPQLDVIKNSDVFSVNITGGEPTIDNRLYDLAGVRVKFVGKKYKIMQQLENSVQKSRTLQHNAERKFYSRH